jgi:hypothetical protein
MRVETGHGDQVLVRDQTFHKKLQAAGGMVDWLQIIEWLTASRLKSRAPELLGANSNVDWCFFSAAKINSSCSIEPKY